MASSKILTTDTLFYLRYKRRAYLVATEVKYNRCRSDILAVFNNKIHEIEVKISKADLKKDFEKTLTVGYKRSRQHLNKHAAYISKEPSNRFVPHYFCFAVPEELVEYATAMCKDYPQYGIWCWAPGLKDKMRVVKSPKPLNEAPLNRKVMEKILKRATSELVKVRMKLYTPDAELPEDDDEDDDDVEPLTVPE